MVGRATRAVLFVSYYFPPAGGSGVQRVLKFVKFLPSFGWRPIVLTARDADYPTLDPTLLDEVPSEARVVRSRIFEPYAVYRRLTGKSNVSHLDVAILTRGEQGQRPAERLAEWVRRTFFIPDARIGWLPFAVATGLPLARSREVRVIVSSAPPYTCHLIGYWLHRLTGKPWVADFRDSWVDWVSAPKRRGLARRVDLALEGLVLRKASRVVTVSHGVREDLLGRHPECRDSRWSLIYNGYDADDFVGIQPTPRDERMTFLYSGSLYGPRHPGTLLRGLEELRRSAPELVRQLRFRFVGRIAEPIGEEIERTLGDSAQILDYLPHRQAVAELLAADVAVLIIDDMPASKGVLTGKLFEYIGARKPILALSPPEGEAARLILQNRCGWVVAPGDVQGAARTIRSAYDAWRNGALPRPSVEFAARFERRALTKQLASLLDELAAEGNG